MSAAQRPRGVGVRTPLIDGIEKVRGTAKYTADLAPEGALVGRIFRSPYPHAEILSIDLSAARALPGVVAAISGEDCRTPYGIVPIAQNEYPLARGKVRYGASPWLQLQPLTRPLRKKRLNSSALRCGNCRHTTPLPQREVRMRSFCMMTRQATWNARSTTFW